jgi:hypothetical protein
MTMPELVIDVASIVFLGKFSPAKLTPGWLASEGLIANEAALAAVTPLVTPQFVAFDAAWVHCEAAENRLLFSTAEPSELPSLCDLAVAFLSASRDTTKVAAIGLNRNVHFAVASSAEWHAIGDKVLPKEYWNPILHLPGTRSAVVVGVRPDDFVGQVQVTVEPSSLMPPGSVGIYIEHNDHYGLSKVAVQPASREQFVTPAGQQDFSVQPSADLIPMAREIITEKWEDSMARADTVIEAVWQMRVG